MKKETTPEFRVSFPNIFKPTSFEKQEPKYGVTMLFSKDTDIKALKTLAMDAVNEKWPDKSKRPGSLRNPFRDGDAEKADIAGYSGCIFVRATSKQQPGLVDQQLQPILNESDFYAGCYARATVVAYAYDQMGNKGVAFGLQNVQKLREGQPFSGRDKAENDFEAVADDSGFLDADAAPEGVTETDDCFA